jgi:hypothetical protein
MSMYSAVRALSHRRNRIFRVRNLLAELSLPCAIITGGSLLFYDVPCRSSPIKREKEGPPGSAKMLGRINMAIYVDVMEEVFFESDYLMATALTSLNVVWPSRTF